MKRNGAQGQSSQNRWTAAGEWLEISQATEWFPSPQAGVNTLGRLGFLISQLHALISVFTPAGDVIQQSQLIYNQTQKPRARETLINRWTQVRLEAAEQPTNISTIKSHAANCKLLHQRLCWRSRHVPRHRSTMKQHSMHLAKAGKACKVTTHLIFQHLSFPAVLHKSSP